MFEPHYQPDPRIPGMGLGFFRDEVGGHRTVGHDGIWNGFRTDMVLAPDDGIGVLAFANTGWFDPRGAPVPVANALLRHLLDLPDDAVRTDVPEHPEIWSDLCGWYSLGPGVLTDPQPRMMLGAGVEVVVRRDQLTIRGQTPIPRGAQGPSPPPRGRRPVRLPHRSLGVRRRARRPSCSAATPTAKVTALHVGLTPMSFHKRPDVRNPRPWVNVALVAGAAATALRRRRQERPRPGVRARPRAQARATAARRARSGGSVPGR